MTVAGTAITLPGRREVRAPRREAQGQCAPPRPQKLGYNSQRWGEAAPQGPDALIARDLHEGVLWGERSARGGWEGGRGASTPLTPPGTPDPTRRDPCSPYQGAGEACGGVSLVPGGAAGAVLADVEVVHEPVAVEEAFPWGGRERRHRQSPARTPPAPNQPCLSQESTEPKLPSPKPEPGPSLAATPQGRGHPGGGRSLCREAARPRVMPPRLGELPWP